MHVNTFLSRFKGIILVMGIMFLYMACASEPPPPPPRQLNYPNHPRAILIMPPINRSMDIGGSSTFLAASVNPLAEAGYYVLPVTLTMEMFRQNGVTVAEEAHAISHQRLHEIFGADAAIYITIDEYGATYYVIASVVQARASARLVDLRSGQTLWAGSGFGVENPAAVTSRENLLAALIDVALNQVSNVLSDKAFDAGRMASQSLFSANASTGSSSNFIKYGPYHPSYGPD